MSLTTNLLIISNSLNTKSKSRILGEYLYSHTQDTKTEFIDLRNFALPFCGEKGCYENENVQILNKKIQTANSIAICSPIYNYTTNAVTKNLIELTGSSWENKVVGFLCAAGGKGSYMSIMSIANSLMLDFRCLIIPRFVYTTGEDFLDEKINNSEIKTRIQELATHLNRFGSYSLQD